MSKKLRVLIIRNAYQQDAGGAEQYALNLCIALNNLGYIPILATKVKNIISKASTHNIKTIVGIWYDAQGWNRIYYLRYPITVIWYMYVIIRYRIDIVHPQSRDDFVFATLAAKILKKKVIWTDHADLKHILDSKNHFNPRMRSWVISASKRANNIYCVSQAELIAITSVAPDLPKPLVIHNGVFEPKKIEPISKTNSIVIGTNARLVPDKGIAELIEALAKISDPKIDLWLLGGESGNKRKYEALAKKLNVEKQVIFIGYIANPNDYMKAMDIFIHASYHEGLSLAIIEAAMLGLPIIATKVGGTPEIINEKSGILINPRDSSAIVSAVHKLLNDKNLAVQLANSARIKAMKEFNFENIVKEKIIPLYKGAIK